MLRISRVHIDYQKNPVGIAEMPQFGWEIVSDKRNVIQKAYLKESGIYRICV